MKYLLTLILLASFCYGQYSPTTVEELEYDQTMAHYQDVVAMNDSIFVVLYTGGAPNDCILKTYEVDADFTNITLVDSTTVNATNSSWNRIVKIDDDKILIIVTIGVTETVRTYDYNASWVPTLVDSWNFADMVSPYDVLLGTTTTDKATIVAGTGSVGYMATINWDDGVGTNIGQLDILYPANDHEEIRGATINDSLFAYAYEASAGDPHIGIINVGVNYNDIRVASIYELYTSNYFMDVALINSTHLLTWYVNDTKTISYFETVVFTVGTGAGLTTVQTLQEATQGGFPAWQNSSGQLLQYPGGGDYVFFRQYAGIFNVRSYAIDGGYNVTDNGDSTKFSAITPQGETNGGVRADLLDATTGTYVVVYVEETSLDGYLQTITLGGAQGWAHKINAVETPTAVNSASDWTKISGVE